MTKIKDTKWKTNINRTLYRKLKVEWHKLTKNRGLTRVLRKEGGQFLLPKWHPLCYCCYKSNDKSWRTWLWLCVTTKRLNLVTFIELIISMESNWMNPVAYLECVTPGIALVSPHHTHTHTHTHYNILHSDI
jgi:hypothetical protein